MNGLTDTAKQQTGGLTIGEFLLSLFHLDLRDKLSEQQQDREEAAYTWGL